MAGLALLAITLYLMRRGKPLVYTAVPMAFMLVSTLTAMVSNLLEFRREGQWTLLLTGGVIFVLAIWLTLEAWVAVRRYRRHPVIEPLDVVF
jgi:carbon starvation protein